MDSRKVTLLRSVLSLVAVVALGGGVTYAVFTSNQVTVSQTQVTTGSADLKVCNSDQSTPPGSDTWKNSISPVIDFDGINPGDSNIDVSVGHSMYIGNDDGSLDDNIVGPPVECDDYDAGVTPGISTVDMKMMPVLGDPDVGCLTLKDDMELRFGFDGSYTPYKTLTDWFGNSSVYGPKFLVGESKQLTIQAKLDNGVDSQDENCTFDVSFEGQQV